MLNFNIFLHASAHMCSFRWMWQQAICCYFVCLFVCLLVIDTKTFLILSKHSTIELHPRSFFAVLYMFFFTSLNNVSNIFIPLQQICLCSVALHRQMASHRRFGPHLISSVDLSFVDLDFNSLNNEIIIILFYIYY